jgi:crossover junction endodeoxyribonuclease RuvC
MKGAGMPNLYIGIDPSFTDTAIVGIIDGKMVFEEHIKSKPNPDTFIRLIDFYEHCRNVYDDIAANYYNTPTYLGIEEPMGLHAGNGAKMGQVFACVIVAANPFIESKNVHIYKPSQIKKFATGKGNAKKDLILLSCYKKWGVSFTSHDTADAYAIARLVESEGK